MNTRLFSAIVLTGAALTGTTVITAVVATGVVVSVEGCLPGVGGGVTVHGVAPYDAGCGDACAASDLGFAGLVAADLGVPRFADLVQGTEGGVTNHD